MVNENKTPVWNLNFIQSEIRCRNPQCRYFDTDSGQDIIKWGKNQNGYQKYFCRHCNKSFVETKYTFLYGKSIRTINMHLIIRLLFEQNSIRSINRTTGIPRETIRTFSESLMNDPKKSENIIFHSMRITKADIDNMWDTIRNNKKEPKLSNETKAMERKS